MIIGLTGCAALVDWGELSSRPSAADAGDASGTDAAGGLDGSGAAPHDGGPDGTAAQKGCAALQGSAVYCEDFDGEPRNGGWTVAGPGKPGALAVSAVPAVSPPNALVISLVDGDYRTMVTPDLPAGPSTRARLELDLKRATSSIEELTVLSFDTGGSNSIVYLSSLPTGGRIIIDDEEGGQTLFSAYFTGRMLVGEWVHVTLEIGLRKAEPFVQVSLNGAPQLPEGAASGKTVVVHDSDSVQAYLGPQSGGTISATVHYDNVVLDLR